MAAKNLEWNEDTINKLCIESNDHSEGFKKWLKEKEPIGYKFGNGIMWNRLYNIHTAVTRKDKDHFIVNCGKEGTGKSTFSIQMACALDPSFEVSRVCFSPIQFIRGLKHSKAGQVFILDEGNLFLFSREAMSSKNVSMNKLFALMRAKNVIVIINVPNFFTLDSYVRDHRVDTLVYIHTRGKYVCYRDIAIKMISKEGSRFKTINVKAPAGTFFIGHYNKGIPEINDITEESYKQHKSDQFDVFLDELEEQAKQTDSSADYVSVKNVSTKLGVSETTVVERIKDGTIKGNKMGGRWLIDKESLEKRDYLAPHGSNTYISNGGGKN